MKYTPEKIFKLYAGWQKYMNSSWERGQENLSFVEASDQAATVDSGVLSKEQFIFNLCNKILKTAQAKGKDIDLSMNLSSPTQDDKEEQQTFKLLVSQIMLTGESLMAISSALDKVYSFGQAVFHVKTVRQDEKTLNQVLEIENIEDVTKTFFDFNSPSPTFHDGNFCGRVRMISRKTLMAKYKNLNKHALDDECEVIDFWFKERKSIDFIPLTTGEYKREDLIDPMRDMVMQKPPKKGWVTTISHLRAIRDYPTFIEKKMRLPYRELPMVFNYGGTVWLGSQYESYPLGWHLRSTQILLNYCGSIIGDIMKSTQADKWLFNEAHLDAPKAEQAASEINTREGGLVFGGDLQQIRREQSQQLPPALAQIFTDLQKSIQSMAGAYFDDNSAKIKAMSGVALDKMFNRTDLVQNPVIVAHLSTLNIVGKVIQSMIPIYYREHRTLSVKQEDGNLKEIQINQPDPQPGGAVMIKNNVKDLYNRYEYQVKASPSVRLQKQNTQVELGELYKIDPQSVALTRDIYAASLDIPAASVISRRLSANMPRSLIQYGDGDINLKEFQQEMGQQQQQSQKAQAMQAESSPQGQYLNAKAEGEKARAQTAQFDAHTARIKELEVAKSSHIKNVSDAVKNEMNNHNEKEQRRLEYIKAGLQHFNDVMEVSGKV